MKDFITLDKYGLITIDKVIFESYYPIIFTCKNERNEIFICVCYQHNKDGYGWLVGKTQAHSIVKLLRDEITLRDLVDKYSTDKYKVSLVDGEYDIKYEADTWTDKACLPKEDSYLDADDGEFDEEIEYFASMSIPKYSEDSFREIVQAVSQINQGMMPVMETMAAFSGALQELKLPTEIIMSTLSVIGEFGVQIAKYVPLKYESCNTEKSLYEMSFDVKEEKYSVDLKKITAVRLTDAA